MRRTPSSQSVVPQEVSFDAHLTGFRRAMFSSLLSFKRGRRKGIGSGGEGAGYGRNVKQNVDGCLKRSVFARQHCKRRDAHRQTVCVRLPCSRRRSRRQTTQDKLSGNAACGKQCGDGGCGAVRLLFVMTRHVSLVLRDPLYLMF